MKRRDMTTFYTTTKADDPVEYAGKRMRMNEVVEHLKVFERVYF